MLCPYVLSPDMVLSKDTSAVRHDGEGSGGQAQACFRGSSERGAAHSTGCLGKGPCLPPLLGLPNLLEHRHVAGELAHELHNCQLCKSKAYLASD